MKITPLRLVSWGTIIFHWRKHSAITCAHTHIFVILYFKPALIQNTTSKYCPTKQRFFEFSGTSHFWFTKETLKKNLVMDMRENEVEAKIECASCKTMCCLSFFLP